MDDNTKNLIQGHIDTIDKVISLKKLAKTWTFLIKVDSKFSHLLVDKGSITIDGISLTIVKSFKNQFTLVVIPHTLKLTNIISLKTGDVVNVEFDIVIKYLSKINKNFYNLIGKKYLNKKNYMFHSCISHNNFTLSFHEVILLK